MAKRLGVGLILLLFVTSLGAFVSAQQESFLFDFGPGPVAEGYIGVTCDMLYTPERGYGFAAAVDGRDRGEEQPDLVKRDFCNQLPALEFVVDLPNGTYDVTVISGDQIATQVETTVTIEGQVVIEGLRAGRGAFAEQTARVTVDDGQMNVRLSADNNTVRINGLRIERVG